MPFVKESIDTLMKREGYSFEGFAKDLSDFARSTGIKDSFARSTMYGWYLGYRVPRINNVDLLYQYARHKGHPDLVFYRSPQEQK